MTTRTPSASWLSRVFSRPAEPATHPDRAADRGGAASREATPSAAELARYRQMVQILDTQVNCHRIVVSNKKGGVTKTTATLGIGSAFAVHRRDIVTAIDANPHCGTLAERLGLETDFTARDVAYNAAQIRTVGDFRQFVSQAPTRFEVIAGDQDPADGAAFSLNDYLSTLDVVQRFRSLILTDTGIDLTTELMRNIGNVTDTLVVPATTAADEAQLALDTLAWWRANGYAHLVQHAIIPITQIRPFQLPAGYQAGDRDGLLQARAVFETQQRDAQRSLAQQFREEAGTDALIVFIPYDPLLASGMFDWDQLQPQTRVAYEWCAYAAATQFQQLAA